MSTQHDIKLENEELGSFGDEPSDAADSDLNQQIPKPSPSSGKIKKKRDASTLRKAPQAPKRFKSSYILFFMGKQQEIKNELGPSATVGDVSKRSSEMWKSLPPEERAHWDGVAKKDKERYMAEKAMYTGPWQVPWKRAKKDPSAPKRPMSAFLYFSQDKRRKIKDANPGMRNTEVSRILGEMWKNASDAERNPHIDREATERAKYKVAIAKWRKEDIVRKEAEKKAQAEQAKYTPPPNPPSNYPSYANNNTPPEAQYYPPATQQPPPQYPDSNQYYSYGHPPRGPYSNYMNPPSYPSSSQHPQSHHPPGPPASYYGYSPSAPPHMAPNSYPKTESPDSPPNSNSYPPPSYPPSQDNYGGYYDNSQGYAQPPPHYPPQPQQPQAYEQDGARYDPHEGHLPLPRYNEAPIRYDEGPPPPHSYHHEHDHYAAH